MDLYLLRLSKQRFKFSAAHMTLLGDGRAEDLHGHNYRVRLELAGAQLERGLLCDPRPLKRKLDEICGQLDEKTLLPQRAPELLRSDATAAAARFELFGKTYQFPAADVVWLPCDNVTMENLAEYFCRRIIAELELRRARPPLLFIRVGVAEAPGQTIWRRVDFFTAVAHQT